MKILFDECNNRKLIRHLPGLDIKTVQQMGWSGIKNGALLGLAETQFDVLLTVDRNLSFQQNLPKYAVAVVALRAQSLRLVHLLPLVPSLIAALPAARKGELTVVSV